MLKVLVLTSKFFINIIHFHKYLFNYIHKVSLASFTPTSKIKQLKFDSIYSYNGVVTSGGPVSGRPLYLTQFHNSKRVSHKDIPPFHGSNLQLLKATSCSCPCYICRILVAGNPSTIIWPLQFCYFQPVLSRVMRGIAQGSPEPSMCSKSKSKQCKTNKSLSPSLITAKF